MRLFLAFPFENKTKNKSHCWLKVIGEKLSFSLAFFVVVVRLWTGLNEIDPHFAYSFLSPSTDFFVRIAHSAMTPFGVYICASNLFSSARAAKSQIFPFQMTFYLLWHLIHLLFFLLRRTHGEAIKAIANIHKLCFVKPTTTRMWMLKRNFMLFSSLHCAAF